MIPAYLLPLANHLWQSTLFAVAVWLLTMALRKNRAAVRHRLWLIASVKFLIPFSLLAGIGAYFPWQTASATPPPSLSIVVETIGTPFTATESSIAPIGVSTAPQGSRVPAVLLSIWGCGLAANLIWWSMGWRQLRRALRHATPLNLDIPIPVMRSSERLEPGVFGILKPVLLLPEGITRRLSPAQFQAVLAHEFCHVRRRDNMTSAIHMVVEAVFWFHPLVWWIKARLLEEQERACDEEVLGGGGDPQVYAESILKICEFYVTSPLICVSGITGSDLKKRIEEIMSDRVRHNLSVGRLLLLAAVAMTAIGGPIAVGVASASARVAEFESTIQTVVSAFALPENPPLAQIAHAVQTSAGAPAQQPQNPPVRETFEVASIRPNNPAGGGGRGGPGYGCGSPLPQIDPRRFSVNGVTVNQLIAMAYAEWADQRGGCLGVSAANILSGGPGWIQSDLWDLEATIPEGSVDYTAATALGPGGRGAISTVQDIGPRVRRMLQNLLADRFQLVLRSEMKDMPVYLLTVKNDGFKSNGNPAWAMINGKPMSFNGAQLGSEKRRMIRRVTDPDGKQYASVGIWKMSMPEIAASLAGETKRPVVDRTNLTGTFDFHLDYDTDGQGARPSIFTAIEEVGLKLEAARAPIEVWVIERVERPTEN